MQAIESQARTTFGQSQGKMMITEMSMNGSVLRLSVTSSEPNPIGSFL
jgi:hypothetical protein